MPALNITRSRVKAVAVILTLFATVVAITPTAGAQATGENDATTSAVALPFIGEFEVWCTDRNPSPFNLCSSHHGSPAIDIGMDVGEPIYAAGNGTVIEADAFCSGSGWCNGGAGNIVIIEHADGSFSRYLHLNTVSMTVGQQVVTGDRVGTNGLTGHSSGAHLHYDEHRPLGQRFDLGVFIGCVDGATVEYPTAFGFDDWNDVPYGSIMVNDGFSCHGVSDNSPGSSAVSPSIGNALLGNRGSSAPSSYTSGFFSLVDTHLRQLISLGLAN